MVKWLVLSQEKTCMFKNIRKQGVAVCSDLTGWVKTSMKLFSLSQYYAPKLK